MASDPAEGGRIGFFGGTFDPPHNGHLIVAQDALEALELDRVVFVPAGAPPHKDGGEVTDAGLRLAMTTAAVAGDPRFEVSDREVARDGPSWTVETLRALRNEDDRGEMFLLMGADQFADFARWREPDEIVRLANVVVLTRRGDGAPGPGAAAGDFRDRVIEVTRIDVSSTSIRERARRGRSLRYLVPDAVARIIDRERLYK